MAAEDTVKKILEYLKKEGPTNTFKLARYFGLDRSELLNVLEKLEEKQAVRFEHGRVIFLKLPLAEKDGAAEIKKPSSKPEKKVKRKTKSKALQLLQTENKQLKEKLLELETNMKGDATTTTKEFKELGKTIKESQESPEKTSASPKIIKKTAVKEAPVEVKKKRSKPRIAKKKIIKKRKAKKSMPGKIKHKGKTLKKLSSGLGGLSFKKMATGVKGAVKKSRSLFKNVSQLNVPKELKEKQKMR